MGEVLGNKKHQSQVVATLVSIEMDFKRCCPDTYLYLFNLLGIKKIWADFFHARVTLYRLGEVADLIYGYCHTTNECHSSDE